MKMTWAIRLTFADGREAFLRQGGVVGRGPIASYYSKESAERAAADHREQAEAGTVITVIERSHGRRTETTRAPRSEGTP